MDRHKNFTSDQYTLSQPASCPICHLIHHRFGTFAKLHHSLNAAAGRYQLEVALRTPKYGHNVRNVQELMDWLRLSELNKLIGFAAVIQRYPSRVVRVLSSFDRILSWMERQSLEAGTAPLRELYRALEAHVWEINPLLMLKTS